MPPLPTDMRDFAEQDVALRWVHIIMAEDNAGPDRQSADRIQQPIAETRIGHKPKCWKGLAATHPLAYSAALCRKRYAKRRRAG